ncbi:LOW QUALITY PROTEIN: tripartite motif-containing protein 42 [Alca torda]
MPRGSYREGHLYREQHRNEAVDESSFGKAKTEALKIAGNKLWELYGAEDNVVQDSVAESLYWHFLFASEQNCSCFPCPYTDKPCPCCHCSCAEHANFWRCCCSCSNDPGCKCCCCSGENSACQYYESKCCRSSVHEPHHSRTPGTVQSKDTMLRFRTKNNASVITPERNVSRYTFRDQFACPLCKQLFLQPLMVPHNHCEKCVTKSKTKAEVTEDLVIVCPVCSKAHCLPNTNKIQLKYMCRHSFLRWRFDHSERPVYFETCRERKVATKRRRTCGINNCNGCQHLNHSKNGAQDHIFTKAHPEDHEWHCLLHSNSDLSEYCLDDHELTRGFFRNSLHNDHKTISLAVACSRAASLFDTIAKFRKVCQGVDNYVIEVILLKKIFKTFKNTKRKEIRNGFLKLGIVLQEQEKKMMELLESVELKKQKEISEYINDTSNQLSHMDGLIQYSKDGLKEESQVFLQSAHCLVKEIENAIPSIFQPSPHLREDPLRKLQLSFDKLFSILQGLVPSLSGIKQSESKAEKYPYSFNPEIMAPRHSIPVPELVIYQTVVYPRPAKIYWTCPTEDVGFFEVEFYEVAGIGPDNIVQTQLAGQLSKIQLNLEVHNLDPNTEYLFKVHASRREEWSEICKIITSEEYGKIRDMWEKQKSIHGVLHTPHRE